MGAEIAIGRTRQLLQPGEFEAFPRRQRLQSGHDAQSERLMNNVVKLEHHSVPAHPQTAQHEAAAVDRGHPQFEPGPCPEIPD
jgi:hypothetical protein